MHFSFRVLEGKKSEQKALIDCPWYRENTQVAIVLSLLYVTAGVVTVDRTLLL